MITDQLIRNKFIADVMSQGINKIYETQENVVRTYLNTRSGDLVAHLQRRPFTSQNSENKQVYYMRIFPYLRFLDINYRRGSDRISRHIRSNLALYNRVVWGVLYHETFPEIKYGYTQEIRSSIRQELEQALQQPSN
ncbi:hypothetical protein [uncultured Bacteroides sp.]|uniref:hypothetical protein n=1 Tax=uncultured Bacteroides sp. TaxID=162156 RepID=UPI0025956B3D|nr:hypothetical protein [uncultured Bacteroides sp.]